MGQNSNPKVIELLWPVTFGGTKYELVKQAVAELALENENDEVRETVFRLMGVYDHSTADDIKVEAS